MNYSSKLLLIIIFIVNIKITHAQTPASIDVWLTKSDKSALFSREPHQLKFETKKFNNVPVINVDDKKSYQTIVGFGFALTGGSAMHIIKMNPEIRSKLLHEVFATNGNNIGVSYLRLSIGASDLNDFVFSYDDLPDNETDTALQKFDLGQDRKDVIPVMKEILAINPSIKILGSPWSPPTWMKSNHDTRGGRLLPGYYVAYAKYFVKYVQQMQAAGIHIDAVTVQNEPLHPGNNPSLLLTAPEEKDFIKNNLGPAFKRAGIKTKILIYDHNADRPDYPITILDDPGAAKYIDGSAFHLYGGKIDALTEVHDAHPDKNIYFTEQMVVQFRDTDRMLISQPVGRIIIGATRNWCRNVLEWNLAAGADFKPYTSRGGCSMCQGAVTINGDAYTKNIAFYSMAHVSKFVRPGSIRIETNDIDSLPNVAFKSPSGKTILVVANETNNVQNFIINYHNKNAEASLEGQSVATYIW